MVVTAFENEAENPLGVFGAQREKKKDESRQAMFSIRNLLNLLGVVMLMLMACSVAGLEVDGGNEDLIGLGEGAEGSPSPLLNPTLILSHCINDFVSLPPLALTCVEKRRRKKIIEKKKKERKSEEGRLMRRGGG